MSWVGKNVGIAFITWLFGNLPSSAIDGADPPTSISFFVEPTAVYICEIWRGLISRDDVNLLIGATMSTTGVFACFRRGLDTAFIVLFGLSDLLRGTDAD